MNLKDKIALNVIDVPPSGIRRFFDIVQEMPDAITLGIGEPDFVTPWHIREAAINSIKNGETSYGANNGTKELRTAINHYIKGRFGLQYSAENEMIVTVGASEAIDLALRAVLNPGDEVLIPDPSYVSYVPNVLFAYGVPVPIKTYAQDEFRIHPDNLKKAITPKTKAIILPYPNNPTGAIMGKAHLQELADVLKDTEIIVISDEIYAELTYGQEHISIASIENMRERTILISGFSKAFAMTGWRLGYALAEQTIMDAMKKIHQYVIMCAPRASQAAGVEALVEGAKNGFEDVIKMRNDYDMRRRVILKALNDMGLSCFTPRGAFYVFPCIKSTGLSSEEFAQRLLMEQKVAVVPGTAFGESGEGFVRCCYAVSLKNINEAMRRIKIFLEQF